MTTLKPSSLFIVATFETLMVDAIADTVLIVADAGVAIVECEQPPYVDVESPFCAAKRLHISIEWKIGSDKLFRNITPIPRPFFAAERHTVIIKLLLKFCIFLFSVINFVWDCTS